MENQAVNGVLDLGICNPHSGRLILPAGVSNNVGITRGSEERVEVTERKWEGEWTFEKQYGFDAPRAVGPYMVVELYKPKLSEVISITNKTRSDQKWVSNVGKLISLGSACFKGKQFEFWNENDIPKIGDWIHFKNNSGPVNKFRGIDVVIMYDESINMKLEDPEHITRD